MTSIELKCAEEIITIFGSIGKAHLTELKAFSKPPEDIKIVLSLLCDFMFDKKGSDWAFVKKELLSNMK